MGNEIADELVVLAHKRKNVDMSEPVSRCPNCPIGFVFVQDSIEKIGQCHMCLEEFKLT